ncbi:hypothetical protein ACETRX_27715 [Labrys portucalensis]|uniref:DUF3565 domain-containing protein n=1 Tax=Labrys neptuniae TaxID=376174 RepID=A0ABV6ZMU6_9HYPH
MDPGDRTIHCPIHGRQQAAFVCQHIVQGAQRGYRVGFWFGDDPVNPRSDAWCDACETGLAKADYVWGDEKEAQAGVTVICGLCYDSARNFHLGEPRHQQV